MLRVYATRCWEWIPMPVNVARTYDLFPWMSHCAEKSFLERVVSVPSLKLQARDSSSLQARTDQTKQNIEVSTENDVSEWAVYL